MSRSPALYSGQTSASLVTEGTIPADKEAVSEGASTRAQNLNRVLEADLCPLLSSH